MLSLQVAIYPDAIKSDEGESPEWIDVGFMWFSVNERGEV